MLPTAVNGNSSMDQARPGQPVQAFKLPASSEARNADTGFGSVLVRIGAGPGGVLREQAFQDELFSRLRDIEHLKSLGADYGQIKTVLIDAQSEDKLAGGNAFTSDHDGLMNAPSESGTRSMNFHQRTKDYLEGNVETIAAKLLGEGRVAAAVLARAGEDGSTTDKGKLDTTKPFAPRSVIGDEMRENFLKSTAETEKAVPEYKLELKANTYVTGVDLADPKHPAVRLQDARTGADLGTIRGNAMILTTGTTPGIPGDMKDKTVLERSFIAPSNRRDLAAYLEKQGLMGDDGRIKPGAHIGTGGTSLSFIDQVMAIAGLMNAFEEDPGSLTGYKVSEQAKRDFQGSITVINRTPGKLMPPRHANVITGFNQPAPGLMTTPELHALFLHQDGSQVHEAGYELELAAVAAASGRTPDRALYKGMSTEDVVRDQHQQTVKHLSTLNEAKQLDGDAKDRKIAEAAHTLSGAWRQQHVLTAIGLGAEKDSKAASEKMKELAPNTFKPGWDNWNATRTGVTDPNNPWVEKNANAMKVMDERQWNLSHSPALAHEQIFQLVDAGIVRFEAGTYGQLKASDEDKKLTFKGQTLDAFVLSPIFDRKSNPVEESLKGQVGPVHPELSTIAKMDLNQRMVAADGTLSTVEDRGLGELGGRVSTRADGTKADAAHIVGNIGWPAARLMITHSSPPQATIRLAGEHLRAAGFENPEDIITDLAKEAKSIDPKAYELEAKSFDKHFKTAMDKASFVKIAKEVAGGDQELYKFLYDHAGSKTSRLTAIHELLAVGTPEAKDAATRLQREMNPNVGHRLNFDSFEPASRDSFVSRYKNTTAAEAEKIYDQAFAMATEKLSKKDAA